MRMVYLLAAFHAVAFAAVQPDIEYRKVDGKSLTLDASVPDGAGPFPTVILVHGGGWTRGDKRSYVTPLFDTLTAAGYTWFSVDYRQTPEFQFPAPADDVVAAIKWVQSHSYKYKVNPAKLVLLGESAGGQLVGYVGARYGKELGLTAVVDFYGPNDMVLQGARTRAQREHPDPAVKNPSVLPEYLGIKEWDEAADKKMKDASPITWVAKGMPPFLCIHGTADPQVPYEQSPKFCEAIQKVGGACEVQTVEGGGHGMGSWKTEWKPGLLTWMEKTLKGKGR